MPEAQEQTSQSNTGRLAFIDWTRGLAALVMLNGHTFHSFTRTDLRDKGLYMLTQFVGGLPPAIFLLLTGITFAFLMDSQERKHLSKWHRILGALKRSRYLFLIAFLFRIQLYVFGYPTSPASELLRVDVLNCMGFAMLILAPLAVLSTADRIRVCAIVGLAIAFLSPVISSLDFSHVPPFLANYVTPSYTTFGFFPWAAFLAFGMVVGSVIRTVKAQDLERTALWMLAVGVATIVAAHFFSSMPYSMYTKVDFWLDSPGLTTIKLGIVLVLLGAGFLWVRSAPITRWSLLRQIGTTSLLVYWVHIELVYGRWFGIWKEKLGYWQVCAYTLCLVVLMTLLSLLQTNWRTLLPLVRPAPLPRSMPQPERTSGD